MARSRKKVDLEQVEEMAAEFCTQEEIAQDMGFERTLFRTRKDISAAFTRGKNAAKMSLRHMMYNAARGGDRTMMIFLAKNELGYKDNPDINTGGKPKDGQLADLIDGLKEPEENEPANEEKT